MQETQEKWVQSLGWEDALEEKTAACSSILAWKIPRKRNLASHGPWDHKESDTTVHACTYTHNGE